MTRVITLGREYGSGGRLIGEAVARKLGIAFYDKEVIALVARQSGLALEFVEETGEYLSSSIALTGLASDEPHFAPTGVSMADQIHILQNNVINQLAADSSCVIVGRCADYILRDRPGVLNVFVHASMEEKIRRVRDEYGIPGEEATRTIIKTDKGRSNHYKHYTGQRWGVYRNYGLMIDSGQFGIEGSADLVIAAFNYQTEQEKPA